jgi:hypothetical protein
MESDAEQGAAVRCDLAACIEMSQDDALHLVSLRSPQLMIGDEV